VKVRYKGTIKVAEADRETGDVVLHGEGKEATASGTAAMVVHNRVAEEDGATRVWMQTDLKLTGRAAQFGGRASLMQSIADRLVGKFATALQAELATNGTARPAGLDQFGRASPEGSTPSNSAHRADEPPSGQPARANRALDAGALIRGVLAERVGLVVAACLTTGFAAGVLLARRPGGLPR
jgi:hypothetical protein